MAKKAGLSQADKFFIEGNRGMSSDELANAIGTKDVGSVEEYVKTLPATELPKPTPEQTPEERQEQIRQTGIKAIDLMEQRGGATVMTPAASELGDATRKITPNFEEMHKDKIHRINPKRPIGKNPFK